ncbi:calumenin-A-like [Ornithodoros turicata]
MKNLALLLVAVLASAVLADDAAKQKQDTQTNTQQQQYYQPPDPELVKKHLEKLFDEELDTDKDRYVTSAELRAYLKLFHSKLVYDNIDKQWLYFDKEMNEVEPGKKVLKWESYSKITFPEKDLDEPGEDGTTARQMQERTERRWKMADANGDGALDKAEFKNFLHPEEDEKARHVVVIEATELMDNDKNGDVSLAEYMTHLKKVSGPEKGKEAAWEQAQQSHFSTYLDKDKDGVLNESEMKDWVLPTHDREEGEAWRLISVGDANQDTKLTKEEVTAVPDYFMGILPHEFWQQEGHAGSVKHDEF